MLFIIMPLSGMHLWLCNGKSDTPQNRGSLLFLAHEVDTHSELLGNPEIMIYFRTTLNFPQRTF